MYIFYCIPKNYIVSRQLSHSAFDINGDNHNKKLTQEPELFIVPLARKCQSLAGAENEKKPRYMDKKNRWVE